MNRQPYLPPDPEWDDDALAGCVSWLQGWRQSHGTHAPLPPLRTAAQVGRDAAALMRQDVRRVELCRLMWAAGRDGEPLTLEAS